MDGEREREALELEHEELTDRLEYLMLLLSLRYRSSALSSAARRRARTRTRIRSRSSRLSRPYPPPAASAPPVELLSPGREAGLIDTAAMDVNYYDQPPEARRRQEEEPEFEFVMPTPSIDHFRHHGVLSSAGGMGPPIRPPTPVRRETARTRPRVVRFQSANWVWIHLY